MRLTTVLFTALILLNVSTTDAQKIDTTKEFRLSGKINNPKNKYIYMMYLDQDGKRVLDSCAIENEKFNFKGSITDPTIVSLTGHSKIIDDLIDPNSVYFYVEPGDITVTLSYDEFKKIKVKGSKMQSESEILNLKLATIPHADDVTYFREVREFVKSHPDSYLSTYKLFTYKRMWPIDTVRVLYNGLSRSMQGTGLGRKIRATIDSLDNNSNGKTAKDFASKDIDGNILRLSQFKGQYVLLDFWGSWCGPCRESTPHLISLYKTYHNKGLEIIGVAQEYEESDVLWKAAVKKDGSGIWHHIIDSRKGKVNSDNFPLKSIVDAYAVTRFPTKILINQERTIVGRYLGTDQDNELDKKLDELLK